MIDEKCGGSDFLTLWIVCTVIFGSKAFHHAILSLHVEVLGHQDVPQGPTDGHEL